MSNPIDNVDLDMLAYNIANMSDQHGLDLTQDDIRAALPAFLAAALAHARREPEESGPDAPLTVEERLECVGLWREGMTCWNLPESWEQAWAAVNDNSGVPSRAKLDVLREGKRLHDDTHARQSETP